MTTTFIGTTFSAASDWHTDERELIKTIKSEIDKSFPIGQNLFINTTWFGPQFDNGQWNRYKKIISEQKFDRVFMLAAADPVFLNADQIADIQKETNSQLYLLGHFDSEYYFNFHTQVLPRYFLPYTESQLTMIKPRYIYINYNRKPRDHRTTLVNILESKSLLEFGIVTLGKQHNTYSKEAVPNQHLTLNETAEDAVGNWKMSMEFGIPHDIHSLGRLDLWQNHFLNIVGETEFLPWDNMFISEKTWKPILGLRPFVINGQQKIYQYLRTQGFKTFNEYWPHIDIENSEVHLSIVELIQYLVSLGPANLTDLYREMWPDLIHNKQRFDEFSQEQNYKINNLFNETLPNFM
jgi:hypothetical protein